MPVDFQKSVAKERLAEGTASQSTAMNAAFNYVLNRDQSRVRAFIRVTMNESSRYNEHP